MHNEELEQQITQLKSALIDSLALEKQLEKKIVENKKALANWNQRTLAAADIGMPELAKQAQDQLEHSKAEAVRLECELAAQKDFSSSVKEDLRKLELKRFQADGNATEALGAAAKGVSTIARMENKIAEHEALAEINEEQRAESRLADELKEAEEKAKIEEELLHLKASIQKPEN